MKTTQAMFTEHGGKSGIAFLYMYDKHRHSTNELLACMLRQFIEARNQIPDEIENAWSVNNESKSSLPSSELVDLLRGLAKDNNKLYLVVDAWDECPAEEREPFLECLMSLAGQIAVFITSRFIGDLDRSLSEFSHVKISANADDIRDYISYCIENNARLKDFIRTDKLLEDDIKRKLIERSGDM